MPETLKDLAVISVMLALANAVLFIAKALELATLGEPIK